MLLIENISHCNMTRETQVSFLMIRLVYFIKYVLMDIGKGNIIRSICRSLEVLLFFVISIVGFNVLVKTTSLNSKSKTKPQFGGLLAPRELSAAESDTALRSALERIDCFLSSEHNISSGTGSRHPFLLHLFHFRRYLLRLACHAHSKSAASVPN